MAYEVHYLSNGYGGLCLIQFQKKGFNQYRTKRFTSSTKYQCECNQRDSHLHFMSCSKRGGFVSDPTQLCVAVVMTPEHFDEYDPEYDGHFGDWCYDKFEKFTYRNKNRKEEGLPQTISFGYENPASGGTGQNANFQDYDESCSSGKAFIIGYELAWTWHGVIILNEPLLKDIENAKGLLKPLFPDFTPQVIVRGQQV